MACALPPSALTRWTSSFSTSVERAIGTILAPRSAASKAVQSPMPLVAPVMTMT